jgi:rod shape-determining protein MreC
MVADYRFRQIDVVRSALTTLVSPIQFIVDSPGRIWSWVDRMAEDYESLHEENEELKAQALILERKVQKMASLTAENIRLRELLGGSELLDEKVLVTEVIGIDPDPFIHELVINKGIGDGVYVGQPLLDGSGVMGQVISVSRFTSRVMLVTDARHAIPVEVARNGERVVAAGIGQLDSLELLHIPDTADILVGDTLVTSGLGDRFPAGYPVAEVIQVHHDTGEQFASVLVRPLAKLTRGREVMLVMMNEPDITADDSRLAEEGVQ